MMMYPCPLDETIPVLEVPFGADCKTHALIAYTEHGGVIMLDSNLRDQPWCTKHHINAIFAHELGHMAAGEDEEAAESWAVRKLKELKEFEAVKLLLDRGIV
jgi:hypothetical protein